MDKKNAYSPFKILHDIKRIEDLRKGKIPPPKTIRIDLNTFCNHDCDFCLYQNSNDGLRGIGLNKKMPPKININLKRLLVLFDEFEDNGVEAIVLIGGGEPTIYPSLEKVLSKLSTSKLEFGIITNGSRLDRTIPYRNLNNFKWVRISLDASNQKTWYKIHKPKNNNHNFEDILVYIKRLSEIKRRDFVTGISFIVCSNNYNEVYKFAKLGKDLGVDNVRVGIAYGRSFGERHVKYIKKVKKDIQKAKDDFEDKSFFIFDKVSKRFNDINSKRKDYDKCRFQDLSTNLGADLNLYTCCFGKYSKRYKIGSLKTKSFREVWFENRKNFKKGFDLSKCPPCWYENENRILQYLAQKNPPHSKFIG